MRLSAIAVFFIIALGGVSLSAFSVVDKAESVASVTAPVSATNAEVASAALPPSSVWYRDPIAITLAIVALFALVDLSIMLTAHRNRSGGTGARAFRQSRSESWRA